MHPYKECLEHLNITIFVQVSDGVAAYNLLKNVSIQKLDNFFFRFQMFQQISIATVNPDFELDTFRCKTQSLSNSSRNKKGRSTYIGPASTGLARTGW